MRNNLNVSARISKLSAVKKALLQRQLKGTFTEGRKPQIIAQRPPGNSPLSFAQQRLWFLHQLEPSSAAYNLPAALRLKGKLNISAVECSINEIIRRHEILRTTFAMVRDQPVQVIAPELDFSISCVDLNDLPDDIRDARVQGLVEKEAQRPFDLSKGPLLRMCLLYLGEQAGEQDHVLLFTMHHIVSDGWSIGILIREFAILYEVFNSNQSSPLPELPIQYADFAVWQQQRLQGKMLEQQLTYWKQRLSRAPSLLDLPVDRPRPAVQSYRGAIYRFTMSKALTEELYSLSGRADATLFMVLFAAFKVLLSRYSGQRDICVGTPIANRTRMETEGLIGFFVNTLVLRTDLSGNPRFTELLKQVREVALGAQAHQELPFERLVEELQPVRELSHSPLFQVMFTLQNAAMQALELPGLCINQLETSNKSAVFNLTLSVVEVENSLSASFEYATDLFDDSTIVRMAAHFQILLEGIVNNPEARLSELPLLTPQESQQLLIRWNATETVYPQDKCLHQLFETQVEQTPDGLAVVLEGQSLTYTELNVKANQLAHYLRGLGIGPEISVGLCVERSLQMIIGILGILKAGGAYVPIDPNYPDERIAYLLEDSCAVLLLIQEHLLARLPMSTTRVICFDRDWMKIAEHPTDNLGGLTSPTNLAYVIFTSGSTGRPKGVMVSHDNVIQSTRARSTYYHEPIRSFLLLSSFAFDSSVAGLFWTLSTGGCLCIPNEGTQKDPLALSNLISQRKVSHLLCLPSFYAVLLHQITQIQAGSLGTVIVAGEACPTELVAQHCMNFSQAHLFNEYGPTEGTVWSSVYQVGASDRELTVPIGSPIAHTQIYLIDTFLEPVPIGISGELYIGGAGLARGYLNRPELTAERFIPNPFSTEPGERLYRTGDLARYRVDGNIEYLGRIDHQVKVRGFRIELGEVEARLLERREVKEAVVIVREDTPGDKRLVAYIVGQRSVSTVDELRAGLKETLPKYMVPAAFVFLDALPLTSNGKVDRKALPAPDIAEQFAHRYVAPRNDIEAQLAGIWAEVLCAERIGIHDNFFDLGGHSVTAVQLIVRLRERFGGNLSLASLFEAPTVAEMAAFMSRQDTGANQYAIDWQSEATPDASIAANAVSVPVSVALGAVLVTGATGFLGVFLVQELLQQTQAKIYCLVRAVANAEAAQKLEKSFAAYEFGTNDRVIPVLGNLAKPGLGIREDQFSKLSDEVDSVYHNGALVNFVYPYHLLNPVNVLGTEEVLRFACLGKLKPVHYVSTGSIFGNSPSSNPKGFTEDEFPQTAERLTDGYSQSKWVAEKMIRIAGERGIPICIYRPGQISGHSHTGAWNTSDFICRIMKSYVDSGSAPAGHTDLDLAPVDYVSKAIVYLSCKPESLGQTFNLNNPGSVSSRLVVDALRAEGFKLNLVSMTEWLSKIAEAVNGSTEHPLYPLASVFEQSDLSQEEVARSPRIDCKKTAIALDGSGIVCPVTDSRMVRRYIAYFIRSGFLKSPLCTAADTL